MIAKRGRSDGKGRRRAGGCARWRTGSSGTAGVAIAGRSIESNLSWLSGTGTATAFATGSDICANRRRRDRSEPTLSRAGVEFESANECIQIQTLG